MLQYCSHCRRFHLGSILSPITRPNYSLHQQIEPLISQLRSSSLRSARHIRLYARAWSGYLGSVQRRQHQSLSEIAVLP